MSESEKDKSSWKDFDALLKDLPLPKPDTVADDFLADWDDKLNRSDAARKGWETRRKNESARAQTDGDLAYNLAYSAKSAPPRAGDIYEDVVAALDEKVNARGERTALKERLQDTLDNHPELSKDKAALYFVTANSHDLRQYGISIKDFGVESMTISFQKKGAPTPQR